MYWVEVVATYRDWHRERSRKEAIVIGFLSTATMLHRWGRRTMSAKPQLKKQQRHHHMQRSLTQAAVSCRCGSCRTSTAGEGGMANTRMRFEEKLAAWQKIEGWLV